MTKRENGKDGNDCAVSEAIGFIIVFGIIIAGIGLVTLYAYPMLVQQQSSSNEQIMEKNMIVLQNDLKSLAYKTVPYSETALNIGGGTLTAYNMSSSTSNAHFSIFDSQTPPIIADSANPLTFYPGSLQYESTSAQTQLSLENGAVIKRMTAENGSTMLAEPRWYYDSQTNTAVIYLIGFNTTTGDIMGQSGVGTVRMALVQTNYTLYNLPANDPVYVTYTPDSSTDYSAAWDNYFTGTQGMQPTGVTGQYILPTVSPPEDVQPARVVIYTYDIVIESV